MKTAISEADMIIAVVESTSTLPHEEIELFNQFPVSLYAVNKCDLGIPLTEEAISKLSGGDRVVKISALTGEGIDDLRQAIHPLISAEAQANIEDAIVTMQRHYSST